MKRPVFGFLVGVLGWVGCDMPSQVATSAGLITTSSVGAGVSSGRGPSSGEMSSGTASSGASSGGTSTQGSNGTGRTGTTTGTGGSNPFEDGGYVYCAVASAADAGPRGDGGHASSMCTPGTYFCNTSGILGNCLQCRTDADCADRSLPTYDPNRPRCDLGSGLAGYQGFCQECLTNGDCAGKAAGSLCDLNPTTSAAIEPPIEELGFETCTRLVTDCRSDGGPRCHGLNQLCNPVDGQCTTRTGACATDSDCAGFLSTANLPDPYCVAGVCGPCPNSVCPLPYGQCVDDDQCGNPDGGPGGQSCEMGPSGGVCACTGSSQCSGIWPVCEGLDAGNVNGLGQAIGGCGCDSDLECADAGFACLMPGQRGSYCGIPCTSPRFIGCVNPDPVCELDSGLCGPCFVDQECQANPLSGGPSCAETGSCGCIRNPDCPAGETCQAGEFYGTCSPTVRCTPASCDFDNALSYFCDWDSGSCQNALTEASSPPCLSDYDCSYLPRSIGPFCDSAAGCVRCRSNVDCADLGQGRYFRDYKTNYCCLPGSPAATGCGQRQSNTCTQYCADDRDCAVLPGTVCTTQDGHSDCLTPLCTQDAGCGGNAGGERCELLPGRAFGFTCGCLVTSDCPTGTTCALDAGGFGSCSDTCQGDADCAPSFFCAPTGGDTGLCRPRCNDGYTCQGADGRCDTKNAVGFNGLGFLREQLSGTPRTQPEPGVVWCYQCLETSECAVGLVCQQGSCDGCMQDSDCASNACLDSLCLTPCDAGSCAAGQVCDTLGIAGNGADICYQCLGPADCPDGSGCNSASHTCGSCLGPNARGGPYDCPPGDICSSYWSPVLLQGVCLQGCDARSCPADRPICAILPALTPNEKFCFGCLEDSDCADAGTGAWCDVSVGLTFTCQLPMAGP